MFHPTGVDGVRRQDQQKPLAATQSRANFVMPLLGTLDAGFAIERWNTIASQEGYQPLDEGGISTGMGNENLSRCGAFPGHARLARLLSFPDRAAPALSPGW